jgi:hypothetical protein
LSESLAGRKRILHRLKRCFGPMSGNLPASRMSQMSRPTAPRLGPPSE